MHGLEDSQMPSISENESRHVVIDSRPGHYLCFPDVRTARDGRLVCVYRQSDQHVATRADLLVSLSDDLGRTWSPPDYLNPGVGHCARITQLDDGRLLVIDDHSQSQFWSMNNGRTFHRAPYSGAYMPIPDRVLPIRPDHFLTTAHTHQGEAAQPKIRQAPSQQTVYVSSNQGYAWRPYSVLAFDPNLVLCEASMTRLPDGAILAMLRENSFVFEPMYFCISRDDGATWSSPKPTPIAGHRPAMGLTPSGKLLVTYRAVGPDGGTAAWMGSLDELDRDLEVHGLHPSEDNPRLTPEGLLIENGEGLDQAVRYALRPMTDPERAQAELTAELTVEDAQEKACAMHFGGWWRFFPDHVLPPAKDAEAIATSPGETIKITLRYVSGTVTAEVNGVHAGSYPADPFQAETRAILFGNAATGEKNGGKHFWRSLSLTIRDPRYERDYSWRWDHAQGHPDAYVRARVLELGNDRRASSGDYGYSGWDILPDGRYFCAYHHGGGDQPGYQPGRSSHVRGTWFSDSDFTPTREDS
jgi:hypothetical protein